MSYKRKTRFVKKFSFFFLFLMLFQMFAPTNAYALTSGPSQPEVQSFEPFGTSEMVDLFTGDFTYNIPLFELPGPNGGYPFNLAYHSGIGMDQEASWVGLGWSLNPGAINRNMRGLPDDFDGDEVIKRQSIKDNWTLGVFGGMNFELASADFEKLGLNFGARIYYNSYKGVGMGASTGISGHNGPGGFGFGLGLNTDSQSGASLEPSLSLSDDRGLAQKTYSLSASLNSKTGLSNLSLSSSATYNKAMATNYGKSGSGTFASYSFAQPQFTPGLQMPMGGVNFSFTIKLGGDLALANPNGYIGGNYSNQWIKQKNKDRSFKAYGYLNIENDDKNNGLLDFNREKDGMVSVTSNNLSIPILTHDAYSILGQGISGSFRPYKSKVSTIYNRKQSSESGGGAGGIEVSPGQTIKVGADLALNFTETFSHRWNHGENKVGLLGNQNEKDYKDHEKNYFKLYGEQTFEDSDYYSKINSDPNTDPDKFYIGGKKAIDPYINATDGMRKGVKNRKPKNQVVSYYTNKQVTNDNGVILPEFDVKYETNSGLESVVRDKDHHIAGFTILNTQGIRYNYTLPVYNKKQVDCIFSVMPGETGTVSSDGMRYIANSFDINDPLSNLPEGNSDMYLDKTTLPPYTTTHLITSVLGADYIDVTGDGPSADDFGYWVKFNYEKKDDYKWRAPYKDFNYLKGTNTKVSDDKASYMYGEREMFYLKSVETKTHIAEFDLGERSDALEVNSESGSGYNTGSADSYKLNFIDLKSKSGSTIKKIMFDYSYDLCKGVNNNDGLIEPGVSNEGGKLTLKKVWFESRNNDKGKLNPYYFDYGELEANNEEKSNPNYSYFNYDRWGSFKDYGDPSSNYFYSNLQYNYVNQEPNYNSDGSLNGSVKEKRDDKSSAWCLKRIVSPSGSEINVEYESDDYAYVQNKPAGQMFKIAGLGFLNPSRAYPNSVSGVETPKFDKMRLYDPGHPQLFKSTIDEYRRVYFVLEEPTSDPNLNLDSYFEGLRNPDGVLQLYYNLLVNLRQEDETVEERVSGYAEIDENSWGVLSNIDPNDYKNLLGLPDNDTYQSVMNEAHVGGVSSGKYKLGYFTLTHKPDDWAKKVHPFALASWQFLRTNLSDYSTIPLKITENPGNSKAETAAKGKQLLSSLTNMKEIFTDYYLSCRSKKWATHLASHYDGDGTSSNPASNDSWVRLSAPDKIKYGGGVRVKKLTINDNWNEGSDTESEYGSIYDYTTVYDNNTPDDLTDDKEISSGVAQYEPHLGGDENSLKWARHHVESIPLRSNNNLFFEYPINESLYPGASVGYSKVVVKSLASDKVMKNIPEYENVPTTGQTEHKFYTAKDYPTITSQTGIKKAQVNVNFPIPFIGMVGIKDLDAHQGYSIELNDMHGRPESVHFYAQDKNGDILKDVEGKPIYTAYTKYEYKNKLGGKKVNGTKAKQLDNIIKYDHVLTADNKHPDNDQDMELGVEYDYYRDSRVTGSISTQLGVNLNQEVMIFGPMVVPLTFPWPNGGYSQTILRTLTSNKVVHRSGILDKTISFDGYSTVEQYVDQYDAETGRPLVTVVKNDFDNPVYSYNMPAHWAYDNMGAAYKNIGMEFESTEFEFDDYSFNNPLFKFKAHADVVSKLTLGDELIMYSITGEGDEREKYIDGKSVYVELIDKTNNYFYTSAHAQATPDDISNFIISRSGRRNHINTDVANIVALENPIGNRLPLVPDCNVTNVGINLDLPTEQSGIDLNPKAQQMINLINRLMQVDSDGDQVNDYFDTESIDLSVHTDVQVLNLFNALYYPNNLWHHCPTNPSGYKLYISDFGMPIFATECTWTTMRVESYFQATGGGGFGYLPCPELTASGAGNTPLPDDSGNSFYNAMNISRSDWYIDMQTAYSNGDVINFELIKEFNNDTDVEPCNIDLINVIVRINYTNSNGSLSYFDMNFNKNQNSRWWCRKIPLFLENECLLQNTNNFDCIDSVAITEVDQVISATAVKYSDTWLQDFKDVSSTSSLPQDAWMYKTGQKGIWRPESSYVYIDDRKQEDTKTTGNKLHASLGDDVFNEEVELETDGTFSNMPVFQWNNSYFLECAETEKWTLTNTMTKYSPYSFELENKDPLDNYSSALYAYGGNLSVGVATNAKHQEIGFESFEEYNTLQEINGVSITSRNNATGNIDIVPTMQTQKVLNTFVVDAATDNLVEIDKIYENTDASITSVIVEAVYPNSKDNVTISLGVSNVLNQNGKLGFIMSSNPNPDPALDGVCWSGKLTIIENTSFNQSNPVLYSDSKAHTGKMSARIDEIAIFDQQSLMLQENEKYLFSAWVSRDNTDVWSYAKDPAKTPLVRIYFHDKSAFELGSSDAILPEGQLIDGWQKIEGSFTMPPGASKISILLSTANVNANWNQHKPPLANPTVTYFDDIRIHPFDASMQTYVYDKDDYQLNAVLDANNFATIYKYNPDGSLFLVNKETVEGKKAIQESRNYINQNGY